LCVAFDSIIGKSILTAKLYNNNKKNILLRKDAGKKKLNYRKKLPRIQNVNLKVKLGP